MSELSETNFNLVCRLCTAALVDEAQEIFEDDDYPTSVLKKIKVCLRIQVEKNDRLPKSICKRCAVKLDEYYSYRESCLQTQLILLRCLANSTSTQFTDLNSKIEISENDNNSDDSKKSVENNLSDLEMSPGDNVENTMSDEEEDDFDEEKGDNNNIDHADNESQQILDRSLRYVPELGDPTPEDYVLMKEETFNIDGGTKTGPIPSILADYLVEFSSSKGPDGEQKEKEKEQVKDKDKDIIECQKLRREALPQMWDVFEKSIIEKQDVSSDGNGETERIVTVTHRRYIINRGAFPCALCGECFEFDQGKKRGDFSEDKAKLYDCQTCGKVFPRRNSWKRHQITHEDIKPYLCRLCHKGFNRKEHLSRHLLSHGTYRPFSCTVCGKQFIRKEHLTRHQLCNPACTVPNDGILRPFCCDVCNQGFVRKEHLQRHRKRAHDLDPPETEPAEPKPFTCQICTKTFTRREHLKRHQLIHQREVNMNCLQSAQLFGLKQEFPFPKEISVFPAGSATLPEFSISELSIRLEGANSYDSSDLPQINHLLDMSGEDVGNTSDYNNGVGNRGDGNMTMDGIKEEPEAEEYMDDNDDEPLPPIPVLEMGTGEDTPNQQTIDISKSNTFCNVCFKNFSRRSHLLRHMKRIHRMQLPPSSRRRQQPQPVQVVVAMKPDDENGNSITAAGAEGEMAVQHKYACKQCGKMFSRKSHLERHVKIHQSGGKESGIGQPHQGYECVTCGETFLQSKLLDKHMQVHGNTVSNNFVWM